MKHDNHTLDGANQDVRVPNLVTSDDYLRLISNTPDILPPPVIEEVRLDTARCVFVVREDLLEVGSKARMAHALVHNTKSDLFCYAQPKNGYAGISLSWACQKLKRECVLYIPEAKGPLSPHQQRCHEQGARIFKKKIYGMSGLRKAARDHATNHGGRYIDMGMRGEPICTAAMVRACRQVAEKIGEPKEIWSVLSTGQLTRSMQIAFPKAKPYGVAVARNMHEGETGRLTPQTVFSHPLGFHTNEYSHFLPPFPSAPNYDAKAWRFIIEHASDGALFWNVAGT